MRGEPGLFRLSVPRCPRISTTETHTYTRKQVSASGMSWWSDNCPILFSGGVCLHPGFVQPALRRCRHLRRAFPDVVGSGCIPHRGSCLLHWWLCTHRMGRTVARSVRSGQAEAVGTPNKGNGHVSYPDVIVCRDSRGSVVGGAVLRAEKVSKAQAFESLRPEWRSKSDCRLMINCQHESGNAERCPL